MHKYNPIYCGIVIWINSPPEIGDNLVDDGKRYDEKAFQFGLFYKMPIL